MYSKVPRLMSTGRFLGGGEGVREVNFWTFVWDILGKSWQNDSFNRHVKKKLKIFLIVNFKLPSEYNDNTIQYKMSRFPFLTNPKQISYCEY